MTHVFHAQKKRQKQKYAWLKMQSTASAAVDSKSALQNMGPLMTFSRFCPTVDLIRQRSYVLLLYLW